MLKSMRDELAQSAMQGMLGCPKRSSAPLTWQMIASRAYQMADAMLQERTIDRSGKADNPNRGV